MHESDPRKGLYESDEPAPDNGDGLESLAAQTIVQMRIYDVLMALLTKIDPENADVVYEAHENGVILSSPPTFQGFRQVTEE